MSYNSLKIIPTNKYNIEMFQHTVITTITLIPFHGIFVSLKNKTNCVEKEWGRAQSIPVTIARI